MHTTASPPAMPTGRLGRPRGRALCCLLALVALALGLAPFLTSGARPLNTAVTTCVFIVLVASYDLLLGYAGIVSFAHTMFYCIGGYGVGLGLSALGPTWGGALVGLAGALALTVVLALVIGLLALRVGAVLYALITLAVAAAFAALAARLSDVTGGEAGTTFSLPAVLTPEFRLLDAELFGHVVNGPILTYYLIFFGSLALFLALLGLVNSPFGRVLRAMREKGLRGLRGLRAGTLGDRSVACLIWANCLAALAAALAGALMAIWMRYVGPRTSPWFETMAGVLLIAVAGGRGTMYGAVVGSALFALVQNYLPPLLRYVSEQFASLPLLAPALHPDRWMLWLGVLFLLSIYFFPRGIVGMLRRSR